MTEPMYPCEPVTRTFIANPFRVDLCCRSSDRGNDKYPRLTCCGENSDGRGREARWLNPGWRLCSFRSSRLPFQWISPGLFAPRRRIIASPESMRSPGPSCRCDCGGRTGPLFRGFREGNHRLLESVLPFKSLLFLNPNGKPLPAFPE